MDIENKNFGNEKDLKKKYDLIYSETFNTSYTGTHSTMLHFIKPIVNKLETTVLDVGCGAGRLSIMLSQFVKKIDAFDYAEKAIETAKTFSEYSKADNIDFFVADGEKFESNKKYDIITISEVLEHVDNPENTLRRFSKYLKDDGTMIISCPNFENFKGAIYLTLHNLFGLPMSLTDRRQIFSDEMSEWAKKSNFKITKTVGNCYDWGWTDNFYRDMSRRIPLNMGDNNPELVNFSDFDKMNEFMKKSVFRNKKFLDFLTGNNFLTKRKKEYSLELPENLSEKAKLYLMDGDFKENLYFSDIHPINSIGGDTIYFLKKLIS